MDSRITEWLGKIGLTSSEIKVYKTLLQTGMTTSGKLIDESEVSRSKIYHVLERLIRKGLVTVILESGIKHFAPSNTTKLRMFLEEKEKEVAELKATANTIIPEIQEILSQTKVIQEAEIYKGLEGIKAARELSLEVLKREQIIYVFGSDQVAQDAMPAYWADYHKRRVAKGIRGKYLMKENSRAHLDPIKRTFRIEIKYLDITGPVYIDIFADYVVTNILAPGHYMAFLVKNQFVADYYKDWFEKLWLTGKK